MVEIDPTSTVTLSFEAGLAGYTATWSQGPLVPDELGVIRVRPTIPVEAFVHELALDYVTVVRVRLAVTADDSAITEVRADNLFLAWPDGQEAGPVLWDRAAVDVHAPNGIVDDGVRSLHGELAPATWARPTAYNPNRTRE